MLVTVVVFLLVFAGATLASLALRRVKRQTENARLETRLGISASDDIPDEQGEGVSLIRPDSGSGTADTSPAWSRWAPAVERLIIRSGHKTTAARVCRSCLLWGTGAASAATLVLPPGIAVLVFVPAATIPILRLSSAAAKRRSAFEKQFPDALEFISRSLKAGHGFSSSLEMLHREFREPLAGSFRQVFDEQNLGMPLDAALRKLCERTDLIDVRFFVSAVLLQRTTGGNLAEILDTLASTIREKYKLQGQIQALSAHGRITAKVLASIPFAVAGILFVLNPQYTRFFLQTSTGHQMIAACIVLEILGFVVIQKLVEIEV